MDRKDKKSFILGISAFYHDSAAVVIEGQNIVAAAQEERFTRKKHDQDFPSEAVRYCLNESGISIDDVNAVVYYDKPFLKFERLLETYYSYAPYGYKSFVRAMPSWMKEKLILKNVIKKKLDEIFPGSKRKNLPLLFSEHHLSHAASAFFPSPFEEAAILSIDGVGEWTTTSISYGKGKEITTIKELHFPHSLGLLYSAFTYYCGFKVNSGEYKLMGLAPYGSAGSERVQAYINKIKDEIVKIADDGSIHLNQQYFDYSIGDTMTRDSKFEELFGIKRQLPEQELGQEICDLALAIQSVTEDIVLKLAQTAQKLTGSKNLVMAGGVALNCVANGKLAQKEIFEQIWIQPAAGDAGGALGAALAAYHIYLGNDRRVDTSNDRDSMKGSYLGPEFSDFEACRKLRHMGAIYHEFDTFQEVCTKTAEVLAKGNVVGWFQGRMEWGPRSLGNRSILADARHPEMQKKLNLKIKFRESFRPFAPAVMSEEAGRFFESGSPSPYMLMVSGIASHHRKKLPSNFQDMPLRDRLSTSRSDIQAVTHLDFSARVQTVHKETNYRFWSLLDKFKEDTGYGILVNTSFNVRGEPIVCTPEDAYRCFMRTEMDCLVIGNLFLAKSDQPVWQEDEAWKGILKSD
jgi:carbamoyltransferase